MEDKKSLASTNPELAAEWHPTKNGELTPKDVVPGSHKKVWWMCEKGHEWEAKIEHRSAGSNCPYCAGRLPIPGETDLASMNPELAAEWHPTKNGELTPQDVTPGSGKKVWWMCEKGHEWQAAIYSRSAGIGCPYCSGRYAIEGETDLASTNPELAAEWHPAKNGELTPKDVTSCSNKKVWWMCEKGHEWQATVNHRLFGTDCPYCSNKKVLVGFNDLASTNPELAAEWHPTKNRELTPKDVTISSGKKVWWQCSKGHEWQAAIFSRSAGVGCPVCHSERHTSFPEQAILYYMKKVAAAESRNTELGKEIDVYLPELQIGIEYNGYLHKYREQADIEKIAYFAKQNIRIITLKEGEKNQIAGDTIEYIYTSNNRNLNWAITALFNIIKLPMPEIDVSAHAAEIYAQYISLEKENSLAVKFPELAAEWHPTKNGELTPDKVTPGSGKRVWWMCEKGHEWQAIICNRTNGNGCPYCSGNKVLSGFNDLASTNPELAAEWHPTKNGELTPDKVASQSNKKVWWMCEKGHEWQAAINNRFYGRGCPTCHKEKSKT